MYRDGIDRRKFLKVGGAVGAGAVLRAWGGAAEAQTMPTAPAGALKEVPTIIRFPEKTDLILRTDRPPQLETPLKYFRQDITPNEAFFVRWHLADVPTSVDTNSYRLNLKGHVGHELSLSLDDLRKQFEPVSVIAVTQCAGNSRSLFEPRMPGGQWGNGAVGNALWTGVRLKDLLAMAMPMAGATDVTFRGLDGPTVNTTPPFVKSLPINKAGDGEVIVAYEMNGQPLPMLNGFPCRLVVPGWYATYWLKALHEITVLNQEFDGFWMAKAYRIAVVPNYNEAPLSLAQKTVPVSTMTTRSLIVSPEPGDRLRAGRTCVIDGVAFDAGKGVVKVDVSTDSGRTWSAASLGADRGRYSFRRFRYQWTPTTPGNARLMSRATNAAGETQVLAQWNRSGYARDVMDPTEVIVV
jgi:DMSO/TMAO reductase YedYZ molybdopterin-dependent catalytic subunit